MAAGMLRRTTFSEIALQEEAASPPASSSKYVATPIKPLSLVSLAPGVAGFEIAGPHCRMNWY